MLLQLVALAAVRAAQAPVSFTYTDPKAKSVQIAGDFNAWTKPFPMAKKGDVWTRSFGLPADGRIEYKFVVDGRWILDPANPKSIDNGVGSANSVWQGTRYRLDVHDQAPKKPMIRSEITVGGRVIRLFTPVASRGLPMLVYGDGPEYETRGKIQNIVEDLVEAGKIRPAILVLVPPIDRMKEYGPEWRAYGEYLLDRVLPAVRGATHASGAAKDVYIGGSSLGGLIALRLAEEFPAKVAGGIQAQSAAIQWAPAGLSYIDAATPERLGKIAPHARLWFDWGTFEDGLTTANVKATGALRRMGRRFGSLVTPEGHNWTAWRHRMEAGLTYLLGR